MCWANGHSLGSVQWKQVLAAGSADALMTLARGRGPSPSCEETRSSSAAEGENGQRKRQSWWHCSNCSSTIPAPPLAFPAIGTNFSHFCFEIFLLCKIVIIIAPTSQDRHAYKMGNICRWIKTQRKHLIMLVILISKKISFCSHPHWDKLARVASSLSVIPFLLASISTSTPPKALVYESDCSIRGDPIEDRDYVILIFTTPSV